jgi:hypothetical protein
MPLISRLIDRKQAQPDLSASLNIGSVGAENANGRPSSAEDEAPFA